MWSESDVILVTGGGNGITSRIAVELASIIPAKYVILGRSELLQDDYTTELWKEENLDKRKKEVIDQLKKTGKRVTPALIDSALANALKQRELQLTLKSIKKMGRNLMYLNCDITDFARLSECVKDIKSKWGPVTGILHGAGFEKSQYINKKTRSEFFGIVDVKVLGSLYLKELCPVEKLKMWVSLSSISGVFGNEAQTDYAAANAFLQGDAEDIATEKSNIQSVSLAWSGWADLGMAWRNTYVRQNADSIGLFLIPPKTGAKAAVAIITRENRYKTFILHGGLGQMVTNDWQEKKAFKAPLLDRIEIADKSILRAYKTISPLTDEWINQHRLEDVPLAPGVGMIELMAETFAQTCHIENGMKFENISFHDAFKLYKCQPREIYVEAKAIYSNKQPMRIYSEFTSRMIKKPELRDYSAALVSTVKDRPPIFDMGLLNLENSKRIFYEELLNKLNTISHNVIFGPLFHDSKRDGYTKNTDWVEWNSDSVYTLHSFPMEQIRNPNYHLKDYVFNFCLLDSIHQTGVIHTILNSGHVHLPLSAREFVVFGKQDKPGNYYTFARLINKTDNTFVYDIYLLDSQKEVCAYALGSTYHRLQG
jgi:NAD(P)-dependent dehydrogenase (short-subunit alcohol dehydrogenase family)